MTEFNSNVNLTHYKKFFIEKINNVIYTLNQFHFRKARWGLVGALKVNDYYSKHGYHYCYDIVAGADTKSELLLHCALRGIEISKDDRAWARY